MIRKLEKNLEHLHVKHTKLEATCEKMEKELEAWKDYGVEGHFKGRHPWMPAFFEPLPITGLEQMMGIEPSLEA